MTAKDHQPENINYWLALWINTYQYLFETVPEGTVFVDFEVLCRQPRQIINMLFSKATLPQGDLSIEQKIRVPKVRQDGNIDRELYEQAMQIYHKLSTRAKESSEI